MRFKVITTISCILGTLCVNNVQLYAQTDVYLEIYAKTFQRLQIDLHTFDGNPSQQPNGMSDELLQSILQNDLWMSGYFQVNRIQGYIPERTNGQSPTNAIARIGGLYSVQGNRFTVEPNLVDGSTGRTIMRREYHGEVDEERKILHRIADDIVFTLTGERGIASSKIAYVFKKRDGTKEISIMDYDGFNSRTITYDNSINITPAWSPDGTQVCYTSYKDENPNLYVYNLKTGREKRVSSVQGLNSSPSWSQDGEKIALTMTKDGNAEIYLLDTERGITRRLTYNRSIDTSPNWSPSNREIVFTSDRSGSPQVYIMDSDGINTRRLTYEGSYNDSPVWSPKGDKIAFVSRTDSGFDIYTIDVTGENMMRLTDSSGSNEDPTWSPNGFSLVFSSNRSGKRELYSMFWDGSDQKKISPGGISYSPAWSPR